MTDIPWPSLDEAFIKALGNYTIAPFNHERVAALITADCVHALQEDIARKIGMLMPSD